MATRTHWLGGLRPRLLRPLGGAREAMASLVLKDPMVVVSMVDDNGTRHVALVVEQEGMHVEIRLSDPAGTLRDLGEACTWLADTAPFAQRKRASF